MLDSPRSSKPVTLGVGALVLLIAGCSSAPSDLAQSSIETASPDPIVEVSPTPTSNQISPDFLTYTMSGDNAEGATVDATVRLEPKLRMVSDVVKDPDYAFIEACVVDEETAAVVLGQLEFEADHGEFESEIDAKITFYDNKDPTLVDENGLHRAPSWVDPIMEGNDDIDDTAWRPLIAIDYSDPECTGTSNQNFMYNPRINISALLQSDDPDWGPVDIAYIVPGYRSLAHPDGNPNYEWLFSRVSLLMGDRVTSGLEMMTPAEGLEVKGPGKRPSYFKGDWFKFMEPAESHW